MLTKPNKDLNRFIQICLDMADYYDNKMEIEDRFMGDEMLQSLGLGYRAFTAYMRSGIKDLLNLKSIYYEALFKVVFTLSRFVEDRKQRLRSLP